MTDPSACRDRYFRPARNEFNFENKKKLHRARSWEYWGGGGGGGGGGARGKTVTFLFLQKRRNVCGGTMYERGHCHVEVGHV